MNEWILPFKGRKKSGACLQNFLWCRDNIYIMDNHKAALWCWSQHLLPDKIYNIFHIDAHYDMAKISSGTVSDINEMNFIEYIGLTEFVIGGKEVPLIRWDNYLSLFELKYGNVIGDFFVSTHQIGNVSLTTKLEEIGIHKLPEVFLNHLNDKENWIINLDLDYFFTYISQKYGEPKHEVFLNSLYRKEIFTSIKKALDKGIIEVLTISLSPECCGGWNNSEQICNELCEILDIDFELPKQNEETISN